MSVELKGDVKRNNFLSIEAIDHYIRLISNGFNWVAMLGFATMSLIAVVDVIGSKFFHFPFPGGFEITSLVAIVMIVFALPFTQMLKGHIEVELLVERLPKKVQGLLACIITLLGTVLFALATWQMFKTAGTTLDSGKTTAVLEVPLYPFAYASAVCLALVFLLLLLEFVKLSKKAAGK